MAEITTPGKPGKRKKQPPRIDLTPMVDLGFLLITFFMFTTTLATPKALELKMPSNEKADPPTAFIAEATITLIPVANHQVAYYPGIQNETGPVKRVPLTQVRDILLRKRKEISVLPSSYSAEAHKLHVLIKPNDDCVYSDVVALLDEMIIADAPYYAITDITSDEKEMLKK